MTPVDVIAAFDTLVDAPDGVKRLREFILLLAVRGRLEPSDPSDEAGHDLLARIQRDLRAKDKLDRRAKREEIDGDETFVRFKLPPRWTWTTIGECTSYLRRGKSPRYDERGKVPVVSQKCIQWTGFDLSRARFIDDASIDRYDDGQFLRMGDLLWNSTGLGTLGRIMPFVPSSQHSMVVADSHVTILRPYLINARYLWCWLAGPQVQRVIDDLSTGSTKQTELSTKRIEAIPVPLPPLAEQRRIVDKVSTLLALSDKLEAQLSSARGLQRQFAVAAVHHLDGRL